MSAMTKAGLERYRRYCGGGGSRNGSCHMSCDYMTSKQLKELNGKVHTYKMNKPVRWAEFKKYPVEFQKEYLDHLISEYNVNYTSLAEMMGIGASSIKRLIEKNQLGVTFTVGHSMTADQRKAWKRFLAQECDEPETIGQASEETKALEQPLSSATMTHCAMSFQGHIDPVSIVNSLIQMLGKDAVGQLDIEFSAALPLADAVVPLYN